MTWFQGQHKKQQFFDPSLNTFSNFWSSLRQQRKAVTTTMINYHLT